MLPIFFPVGCGTSCSLLHTHQAPGMMGFLSSWSASVLPCWGSISSGNHGGRQQSQQWFERYLAAAWLQYPQPYNTKDTYMEKKQHPYHVSFLTFKKKEKEWKMIWRHILCWIMALSHNRQWSRLLPSSPCVISDLPLKCHQNLQGIFV